MNKKRKIYLSLILSLILSGGLFVFFGLFNIVYGQTATDFGVGQLDQSNLALSSQDIRVTVAKIIRAVLGFLGIIAVIIIMYAGFLWMTAGGNEEKIGQAKKMLINAVIGLVIILSSLAIAQFIVGRLSEATGVNPSCVGDECNDSWNCVAGSDKYDSERCDTTCNLHPDYSICHDRVFYIKSITPSTSGADEAGMNNIKIRVVFSRPLNSNVDTNSIVTLTDSAGTSFSLTITMVAGSNYQVFEGEYSDNNHQLASTTGYYEIKINEDLRDFENKELIVNHSYGGNTYPTVARFNLTTDNQTDSVAPTINNYLINGLTEDVPLYIGDQLEIEATVFDRTSTVTYGGNSYVRLQVKDHNSGNQAVNYYSGPMVSDGSSDDYNFNYITELSRSQFISGNKYDFELTAYDIDSNSTSTTRSIRVYAAHCNNDVSDPDFGETGIDVGGECGSGPGERCDEDTDCGAWLKCLDVGGSGKQCVPYPVILDVSPWDGAAGNLITISGRHFGEEPPTTGNKVEFGYDSSGDEVIDTWKSAIMPNDDCAGLDWWNDTWVVVKVSDDSNLPLNSTSSIRIYSHGYSDTTQDSRGTTGLFTKNNIIRPGLCSVYTNTGVDQAPPETQITASGKRFDNANLDNNSIFFGGIQTASVTKIVTDNDKLNSSVPKGLEPSKVGVYVKVRALDSTLSISNGIPFRVLPAGAYNLPLIKTIDPPTTTRGSLVTLWGTDFGDSTGIVWLAPAKDALSTCFSTVVSESDKVNAGCLPVSTNLDAYCGDTWRDDQIIIQMPMTATPGVYNLALRNGYGNQTDGNQTITIVAGEPSPGICFLDSSSGPAPLSVGGMLDLYGVNFPDDEGTAVLYYWKSGALANNLFTWFESTSTSVHVVIDEDSKTHLKTNLPTSTVNGMVISMPKGPGPIKVCDSSNHCSNGIRYNVEDCNLPNATSPGDNYQCCKTGPEAGIWKDNSVTCQGETRTAGYAWRFTTGLIPNRPQVVESCVVGSTDLPSPSPWRYYEDGEKVCVNANVMVRFTLPMVSSTVNANSVQLLKCNTGDGQIDCTTAVTTTLNGLSLNGDGYALTILQNINPPDPSLLIANTWYRVILKDSIQSTESVTIAGTPTISIQNLMPTRPCGLGTAFCFDFKTSLLGNTCKLESAWISPSRYTTNDLGPVKSRGDDLVYQVFGKADQACTILPANGLGWLWSAHWLPSIVLDGVTMPEPGNGRDDQRKVSIDKVVDENIDILAVTSTIEKTVTGTSVLTLALGDPKIISYWPACEAACPNAIIGAEFNRNMVTTTFSNSNIILYKCLDADCLESETPSFTIVNKQPKQVEFFPDGGMATGTRYRVEYTSGIKAIGGYDNDGRVIEGDSIETTFTGFWTKNDSQGCKIDKVSVEPISFVAKVMNEKKIYGAVPLGAADFCSSRGQRLNPFSYDWIWSVVDDLDSFNVATTTNVKFTSSAVVVGCNSKCTLAGSDSIPTSTPLCGNGRLDPGEDCDIVTAGVSDCTTNCLLTDKTKTGTLPNPDPNDFGAPWCGDGRVSASEDCDIADSATRQGCSNNCLHLGTPISSAWCAIHSNPECANSVSACGNSVIETGEECEIVDGGSIYIRDIDSPVNLASNVLSTDRCSSRCLLINACDIVAEDLPLICSAGSEGCDSDCTLSGSSIMYRMSSVCGDGNGGTGEYGACEAGGPPGDDVFGNPFQIVTALGLSSVVDEETRSQHTKIQAQASQMLIGTSTEPTAITPVAGAGDYYLQCGYLEDSSGNSCPGGDTIWGVAKNSCCYPRPVIVGKTPSENELNVCRNALVQIQISGAIDEKSIENNIILARENGDCLAGSEKDVSRFIAYAPSIESKQSLGFFQRLWQGVKKVFLGFFRGEFARAYAVSNPIWCEESGLLEKPFVSYEYSEDRTLATTTISFGLHSALQATTTYAVVLRGGVDGVKDKRGVSMMDNDWIFTTQGDICRIREIVVHPSQYRYSIPNSTSTFLAQAISANGSSIVSTRDTYSWNWQWVPTSETNPLFDIPYDDTSSTTSDIIIGARGIEGSLAVFAQAKVTYDGGGTVLPTYSGRTNLTANFCNSAWPVREGAVSAEEVPEFVDNLFNFSFNYCADAGLITSIDDDLPLMTNPLEQNRTEDSSELASDVLRKYLFFNVKNDDVIGVQIFSNPAELSASEWYTAKFGSTSGWSPVSADGYSGITDGNNYYFGALNVSSSIPRSIYNNIYLFSINKDAQANTRNVFNQIITSIKYNINIDDIGYCLSEGTVYSNPLMISTVACRNDFDCHKVDGSVKTDTNGVCANSRTKMLRDWKRLPDYRNIQTKLSANAPELISGTYLPGYTNSRWSSWNANLGKIVGSLPIDPINQWLSCGVSTTDKQTCWDVGLKQFYCPSFSSIYEYELPTSTSGGYQLHGPLEYFLEDESIVQRFVDVSHFSATPYCTAGSIYSPFGEKCGDGVIQPSLGEQCDPPGTLPIVFTGSGVYVTSSCNSLCMIVNSSQAYSTNVCGNNIVEAGENCDDGGPFDTYGHCNSGCKTGRYINYCGNGTLDEEGGEKLEYCDTVGGVCQYVTDNGSVIKPRVQILLDQSGSMTQCPDGTKNCGTATTIQGSKWMIASSGIHFIYDDMNSKVTLTLRLFDKLTTGVGNSGTSSTQLPDFNLSGINPNTGTPTAGALGDIFASSTYIFGSNPTVPKMVILVTDGNPTDGTNPVSNTKEAITKLYDIGVLTYVVGFGGLNNTLRTNLTNFAVAGGTNQFYEADTANELVDVFQSILACSDYNRFQRGSCSNDCQSPGRYCGDGNVDTFEGEKCDDGNRNNTDTCKNDCTVNTGYVAPIITPPPANCGNGTKDQGEECDEGSRNGILCFPTYGQSCTYCSAGCDQILTVDPSQYCGNGIVDVDTDEECDIRLDKQVTDSTNGAVKNCPTSLQYEGSYRCENNCTRLVDGCVPCYFTTSTVYTSAVPRLMVLNPMLGKNGVYGNWQSDVWVWMGFGFSDTRSIFPNSDVSGCHNVLNNPATSDWAGSEWIGEKGVFKINDLNLYSCKGDTDSDYQPDYLNARLTSDLLCKDKYYVGISGNFGDLNTGIFPYPVNGGNGVITNEVIVSPVVPTNSIRVVIKWPVQDGVEFGPVIYKRGKMYQTTNSDTDKIINLGFLASNISPPHTCNSIATSSVKNGYWWPTSCTPFVEYNSSASNLFFHGLVQGDKTAIRSVTIDYNDVLAANSEPIVFVVEARSSGVNPRPIAEFKDTELEVEVYNYKAGVTWPGIIYKPDSYFKIKLAADTSSNSMARYWHVFNLEWADNTTKYAVKKVQDNGDGTVRDNGSIETGWQQVRCNIPNEMIPNDYDIYCAVQ